MDTKLDQHAKDLVLQHLGSEWNVQWSKRMTRAAGICNSTTKTIKLSIPILKLMSQEDQQLVILHEIAHGIVGCCHGHDNIWKHACLKIGGNGKRCYGKRLIPTRRSTKRYTYECPICGRKIIARRKLGDSMYCRKCWDSEYDPEPLKLVRECKAPTIN